MIKSLKKVGVEETHLHIIKITYENPEVSIILMGENQNHFL
jgi:hypothetical protein